MEGRYRCVFSFTLSLPNEEILGEPKSIRLIPLPGMLQSSRPCCRVITSILPTSLEHPAHFNPRRTRYRSTVRSRSDYIAYHRDRSACTHTSSIMILHMPIPILKRIIRTPQPRIQFVQKQARIRSSNKFL